MTYLTLEPISIVAVDDHHLIREGIRNNISSHKNIELVGEGRSGDDVFPLVEKYRPDILLLDLSMPQHTSGEAKQFQALPAISKLSEIYPETRIIILSQQYLPVIIEGAIERGVMGYILKSDDLSLNLPSAIQTVAKGGVYFSETISTELFARHHSPKADHSLTERQIEILTQIAMNPDLSYVEHATFFGISESTLKGHLTKAFKALGVKNVTAAIIKCMQIGIIARPEEI